MSAEDSKTDSPYQLQAALPEWCVLRWQHLVVCLLFGLLFLYFSYLPIATGQIWQNVWKGDWILENGIPHADPALPLADGTRTVSLGWLGQIAISSVHKLGGVRALTICFALLQTLALVLWAIIFTRLSRRSWAALAAVFMAIGCLPFLFGLQPAVMCQLIFAAIVLAMISTGKHDNVHGRWNWNWANAPSRTWLVVSLLFVLWVNVDVSFIVALVFVAVLAASRLVDHFRGLADQPLLRDKELWRRTWLFELLLLLTLAQPLGWELWKSALWWPENSLVVRMGGWSFLVIASWPGATVAAAWAFWIACSRSAAKIPSWCFLSAAAASIGVSVCQQALVWFALVMAVSAFAMLRPRETAANSTSQSPSTIENPNANRPLRFAFTLLSGLVIWIAFSLSPLGTLALGEKTTDADNLFSRSTPLSAVNFLQGNRPQGLVFTPAYWGDVLQDGAEIIPVFANSNHLTQPYRVRQDYDAIYNADAHWRRLLKRYDVTDILIDKANQEDLARAVRKDPGQWKKMFEDEVSIVYRKERS